MDDGRGHNDDTLDALADLFLTGTMAPARPVRVPPKAKPEPNGKDDDRSSRDQSAADDVASDDETASGDGGADDNGADGDDGDGDVRKEAVAREDDAGDPSHHDRDHGDNGNGANGNGARGNGAHDGNGAHEGDTFGDSFDGPASIPLHPKRSPSSQPSPQIVRSALELSKPAALRLHRDEDDDAAPNRDLAPASVEAVFLGNLPGFGGPWLTQYAHELAQADGPVIVLRAQGDAIDAELITAEPMDDNDLPAATGEDDAERLLTALDQLAHGEVAARRFLVHLPQHSTPTQHARVLSLRRWTLICGADDAAVAAAHRMLEQLLLPTEANAYKPEAPVSDDNNRDQSNQDTNAEASIIDAAPTGGIGVMVMGSEQTRAREAVVKLNAAAAGYLRRPIELAGVRKQMLPVHVKQLGTFEQPQLWSLIHAWLDALCPAGDEAETISRRTFKSAAAPTASPESTQTIESNAATDTGAETEPATSTAGEFATADSTNASASPEAPATRNEPVHDSAATVLAPGRPAPTSEILDDQSPPLAASRAAAASIETPRPATKRPTSQPSHDQPPRDDTARPAAASSLDGPAAAAAAPPSSFDPAAQQSDQPDLTAFLTASLGGGMPLQARCPRQADTQLLLDQAGRLHLLRQQIDGDIRAAIVDLIEARDWVREHMELLALTQRQCTFDTAAEPTLHLFASDAKNAVALVHKLGPFIKLHLLQQVRVGASSTWVCTDLN